MPLSEAQRSPALSSASRPSNSGTSHHPPSSSTIPSPPSASSTSATTLTLETVLQSYPDPLTALEAIIQERNNFSSQNHQLWKLIEKQRAMYTAANRELEKLRLAANIPLTTGAGTSSGSNSKQMNGSNNASFSKKPERPERAEERRGKLSRASSEEHRESLRHYSIHLCLSLPRMQVPQMDRVSHMTFSVGLWATWTLLFICYACAMISAVRVNTGDHSHSALLHHHYSPIFISLFVLMPSMSLRPWKLSGHV